MRATIAITTKNRKDELGQALASALLQNADELLVWDDGSTDGTAEWVHEHFPEVQLFRSEESIGLINARNELAKRATGDLIFSIDDDAVFSEPGIVAQIAAQFTQNEIAAVAMPVINILQSPKILQAASKPNANEPIRQFIGTAHAIRRELFLQIGGYPSYLGRQEEELHLAAELYRQNYVIVRGHSAPIHHFESPTRSRSEEAFREARNLWLFALRYAPWWALAPHLGMSAINAMKHRKGHGRAVLSGLYDAIIFLPKCPRTPFTTAQYKEFRKLSTTLDPR